MQQERLSTRHRYHLLDIFQAALARVEGASVVAGWLRAHPLKTPCRLIAIGKAAQSMAKGAQQVLGTDITQGLVISKHGHLDSAFCTGLGWEAIESAHPVPDESSLRAGRRLLEFIPEETKGPLLFLLSGGASSLVEAPIAGVDPDFLARSNSWLLGSGLDIVQMNLVRKGLSRIKGGGLLPLLKDRQVIALAISDVPGDLPGAIGSGLLVPEVDLAAQLASLALPDWLSTQLRAGLAQRVEFSGSAPELHIVANLANAKQAAAERARQLGYAVTLHETFLEGDAGLAGEWLALSMRGGPQGVSIWGGETTVQLPPEPGQGGRNQHLALAAAIALDGAKGCYLLAAGSDGSDGPTQDAGALVDGGTLQRAALEGFDAAVSLAAADAGRLLEASGDLVTTGPTGTNVMDLVIGLKV